MDDVHTDHEAHGHGGRIHVHATVDHLASDFGNSPRLGVHLDAALMQKLGCAAGAPVRVATERGRSIVARLEAPLDADLGTGVVRLDRFVRQALKAHLNESVEIESANVGPAFRADATRRKLDLLPGRAEELEKIVTEAFAASPAAIEAARKYYKR